MTETIKQAMNNDLMSYYTVEIYILLICAIIIIIWAIYSCIINRITKNYYNHKSLFFLIPLIVSIISSVLLIIVSICEIIYINLIY